MTPLAGDSPITQPPGRCAVIGTSTISPRLFSGKPPILAAIRRIASLAAGIQVGLGTPCPCREVSLTRPSQVRLVWTVIELSSVCMVSPITARSGQWFMPP